ncbi:hypothetical protein HHI36_011384 [Cryptolaemus montrouzieri]|uniref:Uncharacterized protein n=1 Tax=Cryptolaemus montrouzieri TaxID=559131 RepID=A0ABD2MME7_9CUCU
MFTTWMIFPLNHLDGITVHIGKKTKSECVLSSETMENIPPEEDEEMETLKNAGHLKNDVTSINTTTPKRRRKEVLNRNTVLDKMRYDRKEYYTKRLKKRNYVFRSREWQQA